MLSAGILCLLFVASDAGVVVNGKVTTIILLDMV